MWILIIISHILMFISLLTLLISTIKGHFIIEKLGGMMTISPLSIISIIIYVFTQSLILFLIITINKKIKALILGNSLSVSNNKYLLYKSKTHVHNSLNLIFISTLGILFGAVNTGLMNNNLHTILFIIAIFHYLYVIYIQYHCFKQITKLIVRVNDMIITKL